ncbi:hypothetical protein AMAG_16334 [Allomyces macrogynus ATCC 38327]|uniref:Anaphase-promoting complex subunit 4-like WD40 domain-containing protein n=1 Tax=Allomyces macrogynus (strain ATCC 38327) TaxID=578462 RepID=A0A0L0TAS3_ALLM3|nr:hypothetical protein AMAG_16334 [Allomyces macrogynus ATCC 38327]|eukprot:KNE71908.1 hypothetical protein AMAG_16334 [Allomyces macrogynus ATCC 38327]
MPPPTAARATPTAAGNGLPEPARLGAAAPASARATSASALNVPSPSSSASIRAATPTASVTHTPRAAAPATTSKPNLSPTTTGIASSPASRSAHTSATHLPATNPPRKSSTSIAKSAHNLSTGPSAPANPAPAPAVPAPTAAAAVPTMATPGDPPAIDPLAVVTGNLRIAWAADTGGAHVHCAAFSPAGDLVALGLATGAVTTFHLSTGKQVRKLVRTDAELAVPCTAVAWRPDASGTLAAAFPDGRVTFWHATSGTPLGAGIDEGDNQIFAAEYSRATHSGNPGIRLATAGSDGTVRIYADPTDSPRTLTHELVHGARDAHAAGHSNRVFCLRWHPRDPNTLASGGWDSTIQIWDLSSGTAVRAIYGPHICGIALDWDEAGSKLVAGSARPPRRGLLGADGRAVKTDASDPPPLALYSPTASGGMVEPVPWSLAEDRRVNSACPLYVARFSPGNKFLVAGGGGGGGGVNEFKVFSYATRRCVGLVGGLPGAVFCADVTRDERRMVVAGAFRTVYVCAIDAAAAPQEIVY